LCRKGKITDENKKAKDETAKYSQSARKVKQDQNREPFKKKRKAEGYDDS
jgi:hypothetical protein